MRRLEEAVRQVGRHLWAALARPRLVARAEVFFAPLPERRDRLQTLRLKSTEGLDGQSALARRSIVVGLSPVQCYAKTGENDAPEPDEVCIEAQLDDARGGHEK